MFRKKVCSDLEALQTDLNGYMNRFNNERIHQGKHCKGTTPMTAVLDGFDLYKEKNLTEIRAA
jgi:hypothetical protein